MDSDELYDSLDDEPASQNSLKSTEKNTKVDDNDSAECDIASIIPLYAGETLKERIKKKKESNKATVSTKAKKISSSVKSQSRNTCGDDYKVPFKFKEQKTYSNMFYAKLDHMNASKKELTQTARAQWGDQTDRTDVSGVSTHFSDARSSVSDTTSFYLELLNSTETSNLTKSKSTTLKKISLESAENSQYNLRSVSQYSVITGSISGMTNYSKKSRSKANIVTPFLGSLGPDMAANQEKLSLLKKRRSYGQRVSNQNRIKMQETKILRDLKNEIKKCVL